MVLESTEETAGAIRQIGGDMTDRRKMSAAAASYFSENHNLDKAMQQFENYFKGVLGLQEYIETGS